jgi:hypothetical protein
MRTFSALALATTIALSCGPSSEQPTPSKHGTNLKWLHDDRLYPSLNAEYGNKSRALVANSKCMLTLQADGRTLYEETVPIWSNGKFVLPDLSDTLKNRVFWVDSGGYPGGTGIPAVVISPAYRNRSLQITYTLDPVNQVPEVNEKDNVITVTITPRDLESIAEDALEIYKMDHPRHRMG